VNAARHADAICARYSRLDPFERVRKLRRHARTIAALDPEVAAELIRRAARGCSISKERAYRRDRRKWRLRKAA